jgi:hypothetical protein
MEHGHDEELVVGDRRPDRGPGARWAVIVARALNAA